MNEDNLQAAQMTADWSETYRQVEHQFKLRKTSTLTKVTLTPDRCFEKTDLFCLNLSCAIEASSCLSASQASQMAPNCGCGYVSLPGPTYAHAASLTLSSSTNNIATTRQARQPSIGTFLSATATGTLVDCNSLSILDLKQRSTIRCSTAARAQATPFTSSNYFLADAVLPSAGHTCHRAAGAPRLLHRPTLAGEYLYDLSACRAQLSCLQPVTPTMLSYLLEILWQVPSFPFTSAQRGSILFLGCSNQTDLPSSVGFLKSAERNLMLATSSHAHRQFRPISATRLLRNDNESDCLPFTNHGMALSNLQCSTSSFLRYLTDAQHDHMRALLQHVASGPNRCLVTHMERTVLGQAAQPIELSQLASCLHNLRALLSRLLQTMQFMRCCLELTMPLASSCSRRTRRSRPHDRYFYSPRVVDRRAMVGLQHLLIAACMATAGMTLISAMAHCILACNASLMMLECMLGQLCVADAIVVLCAHDWDPALPSPCRACIWHHSRARVQFLQLEFMQVRLVRNRDHTSSVAFAEQKRAVSCKPWIQYKAGRPYMHVQPTILQSIQTVSARLSHSSV